jgi:membrane protease YdiL (CAAX protease family)
LADPAAIKLPEIAMSLRPATRLGISITVRWCWAFVVLVAIFLGGELLSPVPYTDPGLWSHISAPGDGGTGVAGGTVLLFPARHIGLRAPVWAGLMRAWPLLVLVVVALDAWVATRASVPAKVSLNTLDALMVLRTTVVVGLNEEWIFRGLMLAALCRWFGWRRGAYCSMVLFGALYLLNAAAGACAALVRAIGGMAGAICHHRSGDALHSRTRDCPASTIAVIDASRMALGGSIPALFVLVSTLAVWCGAGCGMADAPQSDD